MFDTDKCVERTIEKTDEKVYAENKQKINFFMRMIFKFLLLLLFVFSLIVFILFLILLRFSYHFLFLSRRVRAVAVGPSTASPPWCLPKPTGVP